MFENSFDNRFVKVKVVGVNTASEKISGGIAALNCMIEKNLPSVNYIAIDRPGTDDLDACNARKRFLVPSMADERNLVRTLRGADLIFIVADEVWENVKAAAVAAHCAKKTGAPVIFVAGGDFEFAEDEIIFDALIRLPSKNFGDNASKVIQNFIEAVTLPGQPKLDVNAIADLFKDSLAFIGYGERDGKNAAIKAAKAALEHVELCADNFHDTERILFNVTAAVGNLSLEEAQKISRIIKRHAPKAEILFGFSVNDWLVDKVKFLIVATK